MSSILSITEILLHINVILGTQKRIKVLMFKLTPFKYVYDPLKLEKAFSNFIII